MDDRNQFLDRNEISINSSSTFCFDAAAYSETLSSEESLNPDIAALRLLSRNLESVFDSPDLDFFYSDAKIAVSSGREVPIHRCILSARSPFFRTVFAAMKGSRETIELKDLAMDYEIGFDSLVSVLAYLYSGRVRPPPGNVCVCVDDDCSHVACRPAVDFMVEVLYAASTFQISDLFELYQKHLLDVLDKMTADNILVVLRVASKCVNACERLLTRCIEAIVKSDIDIVTLQKSLQQHIVKQIMDSRLGSSDFPDKCVTRIHQALDSSDVELLRMLLEEGRTTLDDANALHYAVAYCNPKTTTELLDLGLADVNLRNSRGYTVLHVGAMRKEPKILVALLTKGARPSDLSLGGGTALQILKQLVRAVDYDSPCKGETAALKDRLCIEVLELAERSDLFIGESAFSFAMSGNDLRTELLDLETKAGLAKLLFPMEAQIVMDIAQVDKTSEFTLASINPNKLARRMSTMDSNVAPFRIQDEHLKRFQALSLTVELGKRVFPRSSEELDKIMNVMDYSKAAARLENDSSEEQRVKKRRYIEILDHLSKVFTEEKDEFDKSTISSSLSKKTTRCYPA